MPVSLQCRRINISTMFATLRCSRAAASRTASLMAGSIRKFNVDILVLAMRYIVYEKYCKCNAFCLVHMTCFRHALNEGYTAIYRAHPGCAVGDSEIACG